MQYREDKRSGNQISVLGFGCMRFPKSAAETERLIIDAVAAGVNYFDTAYIYPGSEEALGAALAQNGLRDKVYIATKLPLYLVRSARDFDKYFTKSLERLKTGCVDYYLMHHITGMDQWDYLCKLGVQEWVAKKKADGAIRQIGFSFHGPRDEFLAVLDAYDWDFCQIQYNYSDENYQAGVSGLKRAAEKGISVVVMEPLLGGRLVDGLPPAAQQALHAANPSISPAAWGLRWLWNQPEVTVVLSGMSTEEQLAGNIATAGGALSGMLTEEERQTYETVREIFRAANRVPCTGCGYCMPCPRHVDIPSCFAAYNTSYVHSRIAGFRQYVLASNPLSAQENRAGLCVQCRQCESHCPQNIKISEELQRVKKRMEPWWLYAGTRAVRAILGKNKK